MAANPKSPAVGRIEPERSHVYHAEAHLLSGHLEHPINQPIGEQGRVIIEKTRREGHYTESVGETTLEGLVSFKSGQTRVSGSQLKNKRDLWGDDHSGWVTLSTSVIEGLNVFEVITADRMVAQVSTEHPLMKGHVPKVTFLGTRFEKFRVGGFPVQLELDFGICGPRPKDDKPYIADMGFLDRVQQQLDSIGAMKNLPESVEKQYDANVVSIDALKKRANGGAKGPWNGHSSLKCSLVKSIGPIPIPGVMTFGNIIFIPDFGTVSVAEIEVGVEPGYDGFSAKPRGGSHGKPADSNYFTLNMLNMQLGCVGTGNVKAGGTKTNGQTYP